MAKKNEKKYTLDRKKFLIFIGILVILISCVIVIISFNKKVEINDATDISRLNANKYYKEILDEYNKVESKDKFLNDYNNIQNSIGVYIINNSTISDSSFENLISEINDSLSKNNFERFELDVPTFWNGKWSVNEKGKLRFKFQNKKIEPVWVDSEELINIIDKNK